MIDVLIHVRAPRRPFMFGGWKSHSPAAYPYVMRDSRSIVVLSVVAIVLVLGIGVYIVINPLAAVGLAPILVAIAVIIRAIGGSPTPPDDE